MNIKECKNKVNKCLTLFMNIIDPYIEEVYNKFNITFDNLPIIYDISYYRKLPYKMAYNKKEECIHINIPYYIYDYPIESLSLEIGKKDFIKSLLHEIRHWYQFNSLNKIISNTLFKKIILNSDTNNIILESDADRFGEYCANSILLMKDEDLIDYSNRTLVELMNLNYEMVINILNDSSKSL